MATVVMAVALGLGMARHLGEVAVALKLEMGWHEAASRIYGQEATWGARQGGRGGATSDSYAVEVQSPLWTGDEDDVRKEMIVLTRGPHLSTTACGKKESDAVRA